MRSVLVGGGLSEVGEHGGGVDVTGQRQGLKDATLIPGETPTRVVVPTPTGSEVLGLCRLVSMWE
jgi:hypothetical protein